MIGSRMPHPSTTPIHVPSRAPAVGRPRARLRTLIAVLAALLVGAAVATSYPTLEPSEILDRADRIALADVDRVRSELRDGRPWTVVRFTIVESLRSPKDDVSEPGETFELAFLGGEAGGVQLTVAQMPSFEVDERVLLFAYDDDFASPLVGFRQGVWYVRAGILRDPDGRTLGSDEDGALVRGGDGSTPEDLLPVLRDLVGGAE